MSWFANLTTNIVLPLVATLYDDLFPCVDNFGPGSIPTQVLSSFQILKFFTTKYQLPFPQFSQMCSICTPLNYPMDSIKKLVMLVVALSKMNDDHFNITSIMKYVTC